MNKNYDPCLYEGRNLEIPLAIESHHATFITEIIRLF